MSAGCGQCALCCKVMAVPEQDKPQNTWCPKCTKNSCSAHGSPEYGEADQYKACRTFECLWLQSQTKGAAFPPLAESLRPDRSHVILTGTLNAQGIVAHIDPAYPEAHKSGDMGRFLNVLTRASVPLFLVRGEHRAAVIQVRPEPA